MGHHIVDVSQQDMATLFAFSGPVWNTQNQAADVHMSQIPIGWLVNKGNPVEISLTFW